MQSVFVYHTISRPARPLAANADVSPARFERHLQVLARSRRKLSVVTIDEACDSPVSRRLACVTFDDGYADNLTVALPLAEKYETPLAIFITVNFLNRPGYLTSEDVRTLAAHPLVTIGAHGMDHRHLDRLAPDEAWRELSESRSCLEILTNKTIDLMAYPYGACNPAIEEMSRACGYRGAWSVWNGANTDYSRWRVPLGRGDGRLRFAAKGSAAYFPVKQRLRPPM